MRVWIDLDNSPHVPLFRPLIDEMIRRGVDLRITARDFNRTVELCRFWGVPHESVGRHGGAGKAGKLLNLAQRSVQLLRRVRSFRPDLAVSHGSRTQMVTAWLMGVPSVVMMDYEYTEASIFKRLSRRILMPRAIPEERLRCCGFPLQKVIRYDGYKEELYLPSFRPDPLFRTSIGVDSTDILVTIRPSAMSANYHDPRSEQVLLALIDAARMTPRVTALVVSRDRRDRALIEGRFRNGVRFLDHAVDGLQLIWSSDVFVSGGGTMNREAALLGVPAYSVFTGRRPALDEQLVARGFLAFISEPQDVGRIRFAKRVISPEGPGIRNSLAAEVCDRILEACNPRELSA